MFVVVNLQRILLHCQHLLIVLKGDKKEGEIWLFTILFLILSKSIMKQQLIVQAKG